MPRQIKHYFISVIDYEIVYDLLNDGSIAANRERQGEKIRGY